MQFTGDIDKFTSAKIVICDRHLNDPVRLNALKLTGLMDASPDIAFERLAELAAKVLNVPLTIVSLVGDKKQMFIAGFGLPAEYDVSREVPITSSICRYTLAGEPIIATDTSKHPLLKFHPTTEAWGIGAFVALPMITTDGLVLGAFCAVNPTPRAWTDHDIYVLRELTQSVMTEIKLRERVQELEVEKELRDRFVATLSHDLRTPIGVAKMAAEALEDPALPDQSKTKVLTMISQNMSRADEMIRDLLDASLMKAGQVASVDLKLCDLSDVVLSTVENLRSLHGDRFEFWSDGKVDGPWDAGAVRRIVENLVTNAAKYGAETKPINIRLQRLRDDVEISVHNFGNPISALDQKRLFDYRHRVETTKNRSGWGIGLTLVRGLVEAHQGKISVESTVEAGTTFRVRLPIQSSVAGRASRD